MTSTDDDAYGSDRDDLDPVVAPHRTPVTQQVGRVALVVIAGLFVAFALANSQHVDFSWIFGDTQVVDQGGRRTAGGVRLIVLLGVAFAAGGAVGGLLARARGHAMARRRAERADLDG